MPTTRAVRIREPGDPEVLVIGECAYAPPGRGEILVDVAACGLNRADLLQRKGFYPAPPGTPPDIPGLEYAGVVATVGSPQSPWKPGDRVMGIVGGGAMARQLVVHEREAIRVPARLTLEEAAAIPEAFLTVFDAVFLQAALKLGETLLVHSIGSGIGTAALQLALVAGARVIGTSRTQEKLERCQELGLSLGLLASDGTFAAGVRAATGGHGADVVLDTVGASYLAENLHAVARRGRIVVLGLLGGSTGELPLGILLNKRVQLIGTVLRSRPLEEKAQLAQAFTHAVLPLFEAGRLRPIIEEVLPMSRIAEAHRRMEANENFGKYVLRWD